MAERYLEKRGDQPKEVPERSVIRGLEIPRGYHNKREDQERWLQKRKCC